MQTGTCTYTVRTYVRFTGLDQKDPRRIVEVADRDPAKLAIPAEAQSFVYYDEVSVTISINGFDIVMKERVPPFTSPIYYVGGELYGLDKAKQRFGDVDYGHDEGSLFGNIRLSNQVCPGSVTHVVQQRDGKLQPFRNGDVIVPLPEPATA